MSTGTTATSPTRHSQPVRAITSTLSARASPSVPPASQTYEPLARAVLRRRLLYHILPQSSLTAWASTAFWMTWHAGGISTLALPRLLVIPFLPTTLLVTFLVWAFGVLPIVVLRKSYLTAVSAPSSSPSQRVKIAYSNPSTLRALSVYLIAGICVSTINIVVSRTFESASRGSDLWVFAKSRRHPYYLNGRFLFLFVSQVSLAASFHFRSVLLDRAVVRWTRDPVSKTDTMIGFFRRLLGVGITTGVFTIATFTAYTIAFGLARSIALPVLLQIPLVSRLFRPFLGHFLRGRWNLVHLWWNRALIWHAFLLGLTTIGGWEFTESLFDDKVQEPLAVASQTADPMLTLISGITSHDPYYLHLSYSELCKHAEDDTNAASTRRINVFGDQKHTPTLWTTLVRAALLTLGKDYQLLLRRGAPPPPPAAPTPTPKPVGPVAPATPFIRKPVLKPTPSSPLHSVVTSLAADGAVTQALTHSLDSTVAHLPDLFKSTAPAPPVVAVQKTVATVKAASPALLGMVPTPNDFIPLKVQAIAKEITQWWSRPRASRLADCAVPNRATDALIVEVLSRLVCASLTEDRYGVVQRDIPRILEALLLFLTALEEAQKEIVVDDAEEAARAFDVYSLPADATKEAIVRVVQTFGPRLTAFRFPHRIAEKLQGFADYY
ncbi:nucleoporin protein Ndc1-Nup [Lactarius akahatsu]|uniref:Nucleoporin protein Ndc1-Nup n=1 Tax=Lactarius akahatsu TaxID=416441 RepID=A0AAD4LN33_9AGAM|nr:nucleoporin protein Ndc1-Nup [Lactarius akahatsu]